MQERVRGRFVGIGVGSYELVQPLQHAVSDVRELRALLKGYEGEPLADPTEADIRAHMKALRQKPQDGGALVALWSGHAIPVAGNLRLLARDNDGSVDGIMLHEFALWCAASGAHQVLIIIDACYSGAQLDEAVRTVAALQEELLAGQVHWAGVLVSCSSVETARDGLFGGKLRKLLRAGPTADEDARRWSDRTAYVDGGAVGTALLNAWDSDVQRPRFMQYGSPQPMLPNPMYSANTVVKHLLLAARGGDSADNRSWFTGRTTQVDRVVGWVKSGAPGLRVVTGSPGTGKSAVVGRVVSLSNPAERDLLLTTGPAFRHADPGQDSVDAAVHARAMDADRVADLLSRQLVAAGLIPPPEGPRRGAAELVGVVSTLATPPVLVVDGLDEARGESFSIATTLLTKLASYAVVIVSTRQAHRVAGGAPLLTELSPVEVLNLDEADSATDVREYVLARLGSSAPQSTVDSLAELPFLTAWMITDQVLAKGAFSADLKLSLDAAFDRELAKVPSARALLTALTWSYGAGFPEAEWIAVAEALSGEKFGRDDITAVLTELGRHIVQDGEEGTAVFKLTHQTFADHLRPPFAPNRDEVFAPGAEKVACALIRLYRQRMEAGVPPNVPGYLWKYAWRHCGHAGAQALDGLRELAMMNRMLLPDIALAATTAANELTHWGRGDEAIPPLEEAADHFRALVPDIRMYLADLAYVLNRLGQRFREAGRLQQAVAPAEEAVVRYRELVAHTPTTAETVTHKRLAQRIAKTTSHGGDNPTYAAHLSGALVDLSDVYAMLGRRQEALSTARDAVAAVDVNAIRSRRSATPTAEATNRAHLPHSRRGATPTSEATDPPRNRHSATPATEATDDTDPSRSRHDATPASRATDNAHSHDSTTQATGATADTDASRSRLSTTPATHATDDAHPPHSHHSTTPAAETTDDTDPAPSHHHATDATHTTDHAHSHHSTTPTAETTDNAHPSHSRHHATQTTDHAHPPRSRHHTTPATHATPAPIDADAPLARAMTCLAARCSETGRRYEAMQRSKQAVELYFSLAQTNPVFLADLVTALVELSRDHLALGRLSEAGRTTQQAADISGTLGRHAAFRPQLADAALSLSVAYSMVGRRDEALTAARQAAELADGSRIHGQALHNLMRRQRDAGKSEEALVTGLRTVEVCLLPQHEHRLSTLAAALFTLDTICAGLKQPEIVDETWDRVVARFAGPHLATLLMLRAAATSAGDPAAAKWLCQALTHVGQSRQAIHDVHEIARRHYDSGPWPWDTSPDWLTVDRTLLETARKWVFARSYVEERAVLLDHPELLSTDADVAVTEALYGTSLIEAQVIQARRTTAQQQGVQHAYRPWLLASLADEFVDATPARRRELLATRREELLDKEVLKNVRDNRPVHALLLLADEDADVLDLVLDAQENPERTTEILRGLAAGASPQALTQAVTALEPHVLAALYKVVARVRAGEERLALPASDQRLAWIHELTFLVPANAKLLTLIRKLAEES